MQIIKIKLYLIEGHTAYVFFFVFMLNQPTKKATTNTKTEPQYMWWQQQLRKKRTKFVAESIHEDKIFVKWANDRWRSSNYIVHKEYNNSGPDCCCHIAFALHLFMPSVVLNIELIHFVSFTCLIRLKYIYICRYCCCWSSSFASYRVATFLLLLALPFILHFKQHQAYFHFLSFFWLFLYPSFCSRFYFLVISIINFHSEMDTERERERCRLFWVDVTCIFCDCFFGMCLCFVSSLRQFLNRFKCLALFPP